MVNFNEALEQNERYKSQANEGFAKNIIASAKKFDGKELRSIEISQVYAAPAQWERLEPIDDEQHSRNIESIMVNGLQSPIVVWALPKSKVEEFYADQELENPPYGFDGKLYMILSGHNRTKAYKDIYEYTHEIQYDKIPAYVYEEDSIDLLKAQNIIIDTNANQRTLTPIQRNRLFERKFELFEQNKMDAKVKEKTKIVDQIAEEMQVNPKTVYAYRKLKGVYEPLKQLILSSENISISVASYITHLSEDHQKWLYETYKDDLTTALFKKIKPYMTKPQIEATLNKAIENLKEAKEAKDKKLVVLKVQVPKYLKEQAEEMLKRWIARQEKGEE